MGTQVDSRTGGFWLSLLATALVALAFQPLRRSVVRLANRLAYGSRAQPYEALSRLQPPARRDPVPRDAAAGRGRGGRPGGVGPRRDGHAGRSPGVEDRAAAWGRGTDGTAPTRCRCGTTGSTSAASRCPCRRAGQLCGRPTQRLLEALADQTAVAFRNTALETQLAGHVAELDRTTRELAESRLRIIEADDAARRTLEAAITRDVLPYLVALPDELHAAREAVATGRHRQRDRRAGRRTPTPRSRRCAS